MDTRDELLGEGRAMNFRYTSWILVTLSTLVAAISLADWMAS